MDLSVTFHGAVARTTGSAHIVKAGNKQYLLEWEAAPENISASALTISN